MTARWYVLQSKPHKEKIVTRLLQDQGYDAFCPSVGGQATNHRDEKTEPYFQNYLLFHADLDQINLSTLLQRLLAADLDTQTVAQQEHNPLADFDLCLPPYKCVSDLVRSS